MQTDSVEYAGFWIRLLATMIDTLLVVAITFPLLVAVYGWEYFNLERTGVVAGPLEVVVSYVLPAVAVMVFWAFRQATPGKMLLSLRIVDAATGGAPSVGQCVGRYFGYFVSALPLGLGLLWVAFDKRKQGWHDKLAGTVVIKRPKR